ncbi:MULTISPECIES: DJ-1/PfpI/YhbO family deglycase/protease [unclassified Coleofasciculus]|uniref:DJ-1/PfpI/YhbO family deglycase/protease n=1 Tax=unclassified Coleofasciculus TaxID=2692782 RepID=UPI0018818306|nr:MULTISPECIES: DJ-1/PfpI/YhbO family deglycase/protease [unclassified Coleofasciculus]MBE9128383.1 DJ-1/PfpI/YhbO family deglycase/protease [Coleofasciculus sp. LEGE 07081]MBE9147903.1 DJ-1/PfpI/YhbO family deglycase/protease [Coleofasciculus sp. LEGE 07092]
MTKVAILIEDQFEDSEFNIPNTALKQAGANVVVLGSRMNDEYQGKGGKVSVKPDATATEVRSEDFDAIVIPGGAAPDKIRANPNAVRLIMDAMAQGKLIAAVCHGPQILIEADQLRGKQATGFRSIRKDMQNAGATYINEPLVVDGNLITARQPSDLPIFTATLLSRLGLSIPNTVLPDMSDRTFEWWKMAADWGGSSRSDIVNALNTAISGEHYTYKAYEQYAERTTDPELRLVLREVCITKQQHIQLLESRLAAFNEQVSWQAMGSEALATLQSWLQANDDDRAILRRALGDLQTGVVDSYHLSSQLTDPLTVEILMQIEENLSRHEERVSELYRARLGSNVQPPMPTTMAIVG